LVCSVMNYSPSAFRTVSTISDGTNSYSVATTSSSSGSGEDGELWYCKNAAAVASGGKVTITFSGSLTGSGNGAIALVCRVPGISTATALDKTNATWGQTYSIASGTLSVANEIVFGTSGSFNSLTYTESSGFTNVNNLSGGVLNSYLSYDIVSTTASVTYSPNWSVNDNAVNELATFEGATASNATIFDLAFIH